MSYVVSARRWRPQAFEDLIGQGHVARSLQNAIRQSRVAHAFLFTGVRGVGKTTAARILAKCLNCQDGPTPTPCNECTNCREITAGASVDVIEIDGASNTGVDDVRQIIDNVRYRAAKSRSKIYIIDEVHMLSNSAFNALLKTLEEPPDHVKFIFATTDVHKLPATVQSRCQRYDFRRIPLSRVVERLRAIADAEGFTVSDRALFMLAREGEGSMRDAQSLFDQVMAYADGGASDEEVLATLGIADRSVVDEIAAALVAGDASSALAAVDRVHGQGHDVRRLGRDLVEHFRDLAVARVSEGRLLPELPDEDAERLRTQAQEAPAETCERAFRLLRDADEEAARSSYPRLVLEMALIEIAHLPPVVPVDDLLRRIEDLEVRLRGGARAPRGGGPTLTVVPSRRQAAPVPEATRCGPGGAAPVSRVAPGGALDWTSVVAAVNRERPALGHHLNTAHGEVDGKILRVHAPAGFCYMYLSDADHRAELERLLQELFAVEMSVIVEKGEPAVPADTAATSPASRVEMTDTALHDPMVQAAVRILGGEVREVKQRKSRRRENP